MLAQSILPPTWECRGLTPESTTTMGTPFPAGVPGGRAPQGIARRLRTAPLSCAVRPVAADAQKRPVRPPPPRQIRMGADVADPAVLEDGDPVRIPHTVNPVGDDQRRLPVHQLQDRPSDPLLGEEVEGRG